MACVKTVSQMPNQHACYWMLVLAECGRLGGALAGAHFSAVEVAVRCAATTVQEQREPIVCRCMTCSLNNAGTALTTVTSAQLLHESHTSHTCEGVLCDGQSTICNLHPNDLTALALERAHTCVQCGKVPEV